MRVTIRKAKITDLKGIQDLSHALFEFDYPRDPLIKMSWPYEKEGGEKYFRWVIGDKDAVCFVAEVDGGLIGYLAGSKKDHIPKARPVKRSELENMFVEDEYRGKGVGEKLAKSFLQWSRDQGVTRCCVSAYTQNTRAISFYQRVGFMTYASELEVSLD